VTNEPRRRRVQIKREALAREMLAGEVEAKRGGPRLAGCWKRMAFSWREMPQEPLTKTVSPLRDAEPEPAGI